MSAGTPLGWAGAINAREVVPGVARMGRRECLTEAGWRDALAAGYRTVVDLRAPWEFERQRPDDARVPDAVRAAVSVVNAPTEDPDHPDFKRLLEPYLDHPSEYETYLRLFGDRVAHALVAVARADGPVIVHCAAGRDRTGLVVALGQLLAGWPVADIVAGYVASADGTNEHFATHDHPVERHRTGEEWDVWVGERVEALEGFLEGFDVTAFLAGHAVSDADVAALRARFAQPTV
ncbi:MAG TPA: tyrosine-protein phosphatase [Propionibacterium sp.]|nr:tyrosine-protein phosphatase [Propionibacterium sp.]